VLDQIEHVHVFRVGDVERPSKCRRCGYVHTTEPASATAVRDIMSFDFRQQVFSVGLDRHLYLRSDVSGNNPTGQKWVHIRASIEVDRPEEPEVGGLLSLFRCFECRLKFIGD